MEKDIQNGQSTLEEEQTQQLTRYLSFLKYDADNVNLWLDCLELAINTQEWDQARALIDSPPKGADEVAITHGLRGLVLLKFGQYDNALVAFRKSIEQGIQQPAIIINIAQCHYYLHQFAQALEILTSNKELEQIFPRDYLLLSARLYHHLDKDDTAIESLEKLHNINPPDSESAGLLSLLLFEASRDYEKAMHLANIALQKNPHSIEALLARTSLHMDAGNYDFAEADIKLAVEKHPQNGRAWSSLALLMFNNFNFEQAKEYAEKATLYMPEHIGTWHLLAWSCISLNQLKEALYAFEKSHALDHRFAETHGGLASVYALMGERKRASNHIKLAERLDVNSFALIYAKMVLLNANNQQDKAHSIFESFLTRTDPKSGTMTRDLLKKRLIAQMGHKSNQPPSLH